MNRGLGRSLLVAALAALSAAAPPQGASAAGRCGSHPWCDTTLSPDARATLLVNALTPDERISLLAGDDPFGVGGGPNSHTGTSNGVPRVDLPTTYYSDGPLGPRQGPTTAMPAPMGLAATFDPQSAYTYGGIVANEVKSKGNDVVFAPTVNIMRTPLGGRTFEGFGEDPFLVSRTTVGWINGAQAQGVIADVKHFAANNQEGYAGPAANGNAPGQPLGAPPVEGDRFTVNANVDERTLREVYLPAFEAAVKEAHVGSVMCSYNKLNGTYACENPHLLQDILERDWGFKGYVLADYGADHNTVASLNGGLDFEPWPGAIYGPLPVTAALTAGQVSQATIDEHLHRVLRTAFAFGFFDRPAFVNDDAQIDKPAHAQAAQQIEQSATTLLKNDGALPLDASKLKTIAVIGKPADQFITGGGSGNVTPFSYSSPRAEIVKRAGPGVDVRYDDGSDPARAAALAKSSDVALVFAADYQTEGSDRYCLSLECPNVFGDQDGLIAQVAAAQPKTSVVLETGGPVLTPWRDQVKGILEAWYPGISGGAAIASVLFGDADPGGRLPSTFPRSEADLPTAGDPQSYPGVAEQVTYKEGVFVGYRHYDAKGLAPAFPFGAGMSYTSFRVKNLAIRKGGAAGANATVDFDVTNTGARTGTSVPQLYLGLPAPSAAVPEPPKELKGFDKAAIAPGQTHHVTIALDDRAFSYWDVGSSTWRIAPGCVKVYAGTSSRDIALTGQIPQGAAAVPNCAIGATSASGTSGATACASRRAITMTVPARLRTGAVFVRVLVDGHRRRTVSGAPRHVTVSLRGLRVGRHKVTLVAERRSGAARRSARVFRTCTAKRPGRARKKHVRAHVRFTG